MIATNARRSAPDSRGATEVRKRIVQLQTGDPADRWAILEDIGSDFSPHLCALASVMG